MYTLGLPEFVIVLVQLGIKEIVARHCCNNLNPVRGYRCVHSACITSSNSRRDGIVGFWPKAPEALFHSWGEKESVGTKSLEARRRCHKLDPNAKANNVE